MKYFLSPFFISQKRIVVFVLGQFLFFGFSFAENLKTLRCIQYTENLEPHFISSINGEEIWAVQEKQLYKWNGNQFEDVSDGGETYDLIFAVSDSELWIHYFDQRTNVYRFRLIKQGKKIEFNDPENFKLLHASITSPHDIWVSGIVGTLLHYEGVGWIQYPGFTNHHITKIFMNENHEGYVCVEDSPDTISTYQISLDFNHHFHLKKIEKGYFILGLLQKGYWAATTDSLYFVSNKNETKSFHLKTISSKIIPFEKKIIFNYAGGYTWFGYQETEKTNHFLLFTKQGALKLSDDGRIDTLSIEKINENYEVQFSIALEDELNDYSAGCGFLNQDSILDIFSIIPTSVNILSISMAMKEKFSFSDETQSFGLVEKQTYSENRVFYDNGVLVADFDNDFDQDIVITAHQGSNLFYENKGNKFFRNRTKKCGLFQEVFRNNMAIAGDVDNDGDLDLFITREYTSNVFYLNDGFGNFTEVTGEANLISERGGMGAAFGDIDSDGDLDLFVANWKTRNRLYRNEGVNQQTGIPFFTDISDQANIAEDNSKRSNACAFGDVDNDGDLDLLVINRTAPDRFYRNDGQGHFTDVTYSSGLSGKDEIHNCAVFLDAEQDGDLDIVISARRLNLLYLNNGKGTFRLSPFSGFRHQKNGNAIITGDFDKDGDIDLYAATSDGKSYIYKNCQNDHRFIKVQLIGEKSNRDAVGAKVYFYKNGKMGAENGLLGCRTVEAGSGLASTNSKVVHFGTGEWPLIDIKIVFPSGIVVERRTIKPGSFLTIHELQGLSRFYSRFKWTVASIYHGDFFLLETVIYIIYFILMLYIVPGILRIPLRALSYRVGLPILFLIILRISLDQYGLILKLGTAILISFAAFALLFQHYRGQLRRAELERLTDQLLQEIVQFQHGEWARSNINQLLLFSQNMKDKKQFDKTFRNKFFEAIHYFIQTTYPAIQRILRLSQFTSANHELTNKLDLSARAIYRNVEAIKNSIQLEEKIPLNRVTILSDHICSFKALIDKLRSAIERNYDTSLWKMMEQLRAITTSSAKLNIDWQMLTFDGVHVRIRPSHLLAILDNLMQNAIQATAGKPDANLTIFGEKKGNQFHIHFTDNGIGMTEGMVKKIFEKGFTMSRDSDRGRGLAFSRELLRRYGGDIFVNHTRVGGGTDMVVRLEMILVNES